MGTKVERLTKLVDVADRFDHSHAELRDAQTEAMDEIFQDRKDRIALLGHRAGEAGITEIRSRADIVPLLFPHTAYKSYPESFLANERWDRLGKWLGTISPYPIGPIDTTDVVGIDDWLDRLEANGHYVSCSSGTTGKSAMLIASGRDMDWSRVDTVQVFSWGAGLVPEQDRRIFRVAPRAHVPKNTTIAAAQNAAFGDPRFEVFGLPIPPITVGQLTKMIVLRKAIVDGTAKPEELAEFEETSHQREAALEKAYTIAAEEIIAARSDKLMITGLWNALFHVASLVRDQGYGGDDFHPDNVLYVGGGLKRAQLPADYQEFVYGTFNVPDSRHFQNYSMQELNSGMPRCREGNRYHVPPWMVPLVLNEDGTEMLPHERGQAEGRAAFVDLALDGRWNGVITGDKITLDLDPCPCGHAGPTVLNDIVRYADLAGDDKIGCAGTVDAYVRGMS